MLLDVLALVEVFLYSYKKALKKKKCLLRFSHFCVQLANRLKPKACKALP